VIENKKMRDASGCLMCHLTGIFADQRDPAYEAWLLDFILQNKQKATPAAHFSTFRTFLSVGKLFNSLDNFEVAQAWHALLNSAGTYFDGLQILFSEESSHALLEVNREVQSPFRVLLDVQVPSLHEHENTPVQDSFQRLMQIIRLSMDCSALPVDAIQLLPTDDLWLEGEIRSKIHPKAHYILRHVRSALDRITASQALLVQTRGSFLDVKNYFSDGNNEAQLAGSPDLASAILQALISEDTTPLTAITNQFNSVSLETGYFHAFNLAEDLLSEFTQHDLDSRQRFLLACFVLFSCAGVAALDLQTLFSIFMPMDSYEAPLSEQTQALFSSQAFQPLAEMLSFRIQQPAFHPLGAQIPLIDMPHIWGVQRFSVDMADNVLCLSNFSSSMQEIRLGDDDIAPGSIWQDFRGEKQFSAGKIWQLNPYEYVWLAQKNK
jgi:hypothetical protein